MNNDIDSLLEKYRDEVAAVLNVLVECPYFYKDDNENLYYFMHRYRNEFGDFFRKYYDWEFIIDSKCARVYKNKWYNDAVKPEQRAQFRVTGRDEAIAFMCLLEFFERQLDDNSITAEDKHNLRFTFGDLLQYCHKRFIQLFENKKDRYNEEYIRSKILRQLMPKLLQFRFLKEIRPEGKMHGLNRYKYDFIYEALPALYHYNTGRLTGEVVGSYEKEDRDNSNVQDHGYNDDNLGVEEHENG
ncbi:MAG: hypothetical protein K9M56_07300 [Victivallales bacterium]|nr:hypothetical protein [Victivallales bacterium]